MIPNRRPVGKDVLTSVEILYRKYSDVLLRIAKNYVDDGSLAEDIVQNVFLNAIRYPKTLFELAPESKIYFLIRMTINASYKVRENEKKFSHSTLVYENGDDKEFMMDTSDSCSDIMDYHILIKHIEKLPKKIRDTIKARFIYGLNRKETSQIFHITERAVKLRCKKGRELLLEYQNIENPQ